MISLKQARRDRAQALPARSSREQRAQQRIDLDQRPPTLVALSDQRRAALFSEAARTKAKALATVTPVTDTSSKGRRAACIA